MVSSPARHNSLHPQTLMQDSHPRPQLTRPGWEDLGGTWAFAFDDAAVGISEHWQQRDDVFDRTIQVPFPFESPASGINDTGFHPVVWYRRTFEATARPGRRLLLHFGAVDYRAHVWVNGVAVAYHEGGHTPFTADITSALDDAGSRSWSSVPRTAPRDLRQPRGKQDWQREPHAIWYDRTSGIWQPVWLEDGARDAGSARCAGRRTSTGAASDLTRPAAHRPAGGAAAAPARWCCGRRGEVLADDTYAVSHVEVQRRITLTENDMSLGHSDLLWSPEHPNLHRRDGHAARRTTG